jgi:hypothetical protein
MARTMDISQLFQLPLSDEAFDQVLLLAQALEDLQISYLEDVWSYSWGTSLSPKRAYLHLIGSRQFHPSFKWLWKASAQKQHKVFFWLLLKDRLSTRNILRRKNQLLPYYDCVLYVLCVEETLYHLFLNCTFAHNSWSPLNLNIPPGDPFDVLLSFQNQLNVSFFMDIIILMSWSIWMARNDLVFQGQQPNLQSVKSSLPEGICSSYP